MTRLVLDGYDLNVGKRRASQGGGGDPGRVWCRMRLERLGRGTGYKKILGLLKG